MIYQDLFRQVLLVPASELHGGRLRIVSGYATAGMVDRHMEHLKELKLDVSIELIIGMTVQEGIQEVQHNALCKLMNNSPWGIDFQCRYIVRGNPVHAKSYVWLDPSGRPSKAFCGSSNYTMSGFGKAQVNNMSLTDSEKANQFHDHLLRWTADCVQPHIETQILLKPSSEAEQSSELESVKLSLLVGRTGETPTKSGINWGQRPGRNPNQAYINIPVDVRRQGFFPERYEQFTVLTDDGDSFIFVRAQDEGKGLHTTQDNSLLGEYIRVRLGVGSGAYVTRQHLIEYGRTDVTFTKIDPETYLMDFRPTSEPGEDSEIWPDK